MADNVHGTLALCSLFLVRCSSPYTRDMKRYLVWGLSALVAIGAFALARALDLPSGIVLVVAFIGAIAGTAGATWLVQRLLGEAEAPPPAPPGRGSGKKAR